MTASPEVEAADNHQLPSLTSLIVEAVRLVGKHAGEYYGFAGWLLVPLLLSVGAYATGGSLGILILNIANAATFMLVMWLLAACILLTAAHVMHPERTVDPRHLSRISWERTFGLVVTLLAAAVLELFGIIALVVPGLIISVYLSFASQEAILHNHTFLRGLAASRDRVKGRFFAVFFRVVGLTAFAAVGYVMIGSLVVSIASTLGIMTPNDLLTAPPLWFATLLGLIEIAALPILITAHTLLYLSLKRR
ncbi:MAG: hypothetical protein NUV56_02355 [Candidatus Uhrbacteria bacterium]|nr:hypothetical protein [Candidatus Uhrbacteria bacterium]